MQLIAIRLRRPRRRSPSAWQQSCRPLESAFDAQALPCHTRCRGTQTRLPGAGPTQPQRNEAADARAHESSAAGKAAAAHDDPLGDTIGFVDHEQEPLEYPRLAQCVSCRTTQVARATLKANALSMGSTLLAVSGACSGCSAHDPTWAKNTTPGNTRSPPDFSVFQSDMICISLGNSYLATKWA